MTKKSVKLELPILTFNWNKHGDVCQYLDYLEDLLMEVFTPHNQAPADLARRRDEVLTDATGSTGDLLGRRKLGWSATSRPKSLKILWRMWHKGMDRSYVMTVGHDSMAPYIFNSFCPLYAALSCWKWMICWISIVSSHLMSKVESNESYNTKR